MFLGEAVEFVTLMGTRVFISPHSVTMVEEHPNGVAIATDRFIFHVSGPVEDVINMLKIKVQNGD